MVQKRGTRSSNRKKARPQPPPSRFKLWLRRILIGGGAFAALALLALVTSVYFAARSMPGYATLMNQQTGPTIVVAST